MNIEMYRLFFDVQQRHWWFIARRNIVVDVIARHFRPGAGSRVLDIGCGAGLMLNVLGRFGETCGVDNSEVAVELSRETFAGTVRVGQLPDQVPYPEGSFHLITALDVIEHIVDDVESLRSIHRLLAPGGKAVITVPAFMFLWTEFDEINEHQRRYSRGQLEARLRQAGFSIEKLSYFNSFLFPMVLGVRILNRLFGRSGARDLEVPGRRINKLLCGIFGMEKPLLRFLDFPFGVSLLAVVRR